MRQNNAHLTGTTGRPCSANDLFFVSEGIQCGNCLVLVRDDRSDAVRQQHRDNFREGVPGTWIVNGSPMNVISTRALINRAQDLEADQGRDTESQLLRGRAALIERRPTVCDPIPGLCDVLRGSITPDYWVEPCEGCAFIGYRDNRDEENVDEQLRHLAGTLGVCGFPVRILCGLSTEGRAHWLEVLPA